MKKYDYKNSSRQISNRKYTLAFSIETFDKVSAIIQVIYRFRNKILK